jgi:Protein of unknown function (DUF3306)
MARDEDFLRRWSRRKRETDAAASAPAAPDAAPAPELPPLDSIDFESDFKAFMHAKVDEGVKRAALKKLFSDPRFNVMDGLDVYIEDFSKGETLTPEMVATLEHAKSTLLGRREEEKKEEKTEEPQEASAKKDDGDTRQDT